MTGRPLRLAAGAMGTRFELVLLDGPGDLRAAGEAAVDQIEMWHRRLSRFEPDSFVSHINREAARGPVRLDRDTFELLQDALTVWRASEGAFDITIAPAMTRSGYGDSAVPAGHAEVGAGTLRLDPDHWTIEFTGPQVSIDLGGIGKGHALDCAARVLREAGVSSALLHAGTSSVVAIGAPGRGDGWQIDVPAGNERRTIALRDAAMSVSDPGGPADARRGAPHILDPRDGRPVPRPVRATVIGPSARLADAWSTALVVRGSTPASFPSRFFSAFIDVYDQAPV
jgi:thiamine biosynthesis lipoprotein